jgi:hypothetical protein
MSLQTNSEHVLKNKVREGIFSAEIKILIFEYTQIIIPDVFKKCVAVAVDKNEYLIMKIININMKQANK